MRAYVISLPQSRERRRHVQQELDNSGIEYEFVNAVDGAALPQSGRASLVDVSIEGAPQWLSAPGAIGCALSHLDVYRRIIETDDRAAAVLEDDVVIGSDTADVIDALEPLLEGGDLVLLHFRSFTPCRFSRVGAVALPGGRALAFPVDRAAPISSAAYVVTRGACERLVEAILPVRASADSWAHFCALGAVRRLRCVVPAPVGVDPHFRTTLGYRPWGNRTLARFTAVVGDKRLPPFHQAFTALRRRQLRRWSQVEWVEDPPDYLDGSSM